MPGYHLRKPSLLTQEELRIKKKRILQDTCAGEGWGKGALLGNFSNVILSERLFLATWDEFSSQSFYFPYFFLSHFETFFKLKKNVGGLHLEHMEVPRLGAEWELHLLAYATATATATGARVWEPCIFDLHCS